MEGEHTAEQSSRLREKPRQWPLDESKQGTWKDLKSFYNQSTKGRAGVGMGVGEPYCGSWTGTQGQTRRGISGWGLGGMEGIEAGRSTITFCSHSLTQNVRWRRDWEDPSCWEDVGETWVPLIEGASRPGKCSGSVLPSPTFRNRTI